MHNILVVTGSVRPNSVNQVIVPLVTEKVSKMGANPIVANLGKLNMPFFDGTVPPSSPDFKTDHESVNAWTKMVADADGVIFVTPEYNHTMSPVQLNAIDWIGKEWEHKPVALVGYGWTSGASMAHATAREALAVNLKARIGDSQTNLFFTKELNADGSVANEDAINESLEATISELFEIIG